MKDFAMKIQNVQTETYLLQKNIFFANFLKYKDLITSSITGLPKVSLTTDCYDLWTSN